MILLQHGLGMVMGTVSLMQSGVLRVVCPFKAQTNVLYILFVCYTLATVMGRFQIKFLARMGFNCIFCFFDFLWSKACFIASNCLHKTNIMTIILICYLKKVDFIVSSSKKIEKAQFTSLKHVAVFSLTHVRNDCSLSKSNFTQN